jgi:hypothetical protein
MLVLPTYWLNAKKDTEYKASILGELVNISRLSKVFTASEVSLTKSIPE